MLTAILPVQTLLLAIFVLMGGGGFLGTLISLRLEQTGVASLTIGLVATAYFAGLTLGSLRGPQIIQRVGHIRAFAAFLSIYSASALVYGFVRDPTLWTALRFIDGFCMAGVFVCLESWLNERAEPRTRGAVLAGYMIALYSGQAAGQFLINLNDVAPTLPFMAASLLLSLAVVPVALTRILQPALGDRVPLAIGRLYAASPLGIVGATATGVMLGAFYALGAVYVRRLGLDLSTAALFVTVVILGGVVLQWPLGRLSDRFDRRRVIVGCFAAAVVVSAAIAAIGETGIVLLILGAAFGGVTFALYPLCVAHTNDHLSSEERVSASGGLVLSYSVGAAIGPLAGAAAMDVVGVLGLFGFIGLCAAAATSFGLWRERTAEAVPSEHQLPFQTLPRTTPMSAELDPHGSESS